MVHFRQEDDPCSSKDGPDGETYVYNNKECLYSMSAFYNETKL